MDTLLKNFPSSQGFRRAAIASLGLAAVALAVSPAAAATDEPTSCAWPFEWTPYGLGWFWPDSGSRYPYMRFDDGWKEMTITGAYPEARYMSYHAYYFTNFETNELGDHLYDAQIMPDRGSINPFVPAEDESRTERLRKRVPTYTITVTRDQSAEGTNVLRVTEDPPWVMLRVYLPDRTGARTPWVASRCQPSP